MTAVPTMLVSMMEHPRFASTDLSSLQNISSGSATVPAALVTAFEEHLGARFTILVGQTECSPVASMTYPTDSVSDKSETIGSPMPNVEVRIVDVMTGETLPVGQVGEFCTRGYYVMRGYFENPEATAATIDADGWLHTGDLCSMNDRVYCTIEGRLKDMIIRGGENIYPREVESCCSLIRTSARWPSSGCPTRNGARKSPRSFALRLAHESTSTSSSPTCASTSHRTRRHDTGSRSTRSP